VIRRSAVVALVLGCAAVASGGSAPAAGPSSLLVTENEFHTVLSRAQVPPGRAIIQLLNRGEDDHDLRLRRITRRSGAPVARWALTHPGELSELSLTLKTGRYRLWCSLPGHRALGMRATLRVLRVR
jgi:hypothetical protein